jgi:erythromycin esterase
VKIKNIRSIFIAIMVFLVLLLGCATEKQGIARYAGDISTLTIPEEVKIVGLGEATHSNAEFQSVRLDVFKVLVENYGFRTFALEDGFATGLKLNAYVHGSEMTLQEAMADMLVLYKTEEMASLFNWMREYNASAPASDQLSYYGFDVQDWEIQVKVVDQFLRGVTDHSMIDLEEYQALMDRLTSRNIRRVLYYMYMPEEYTPGGSAEPLQFLLDKYDLSNYASVQQKYKTQLYTDIRLLAELYELMNSARYNLLNPTYSESEYNQVLQTVQILLYNVKLDSEAIAGDFASPDGGLYFTRDKKMKEMVDWIVNVEDNPIMIAGHSGHLAKGDAFDKFLATSSINRTGNLLAESYGDAYYSIGTSFASGEVATNIDIFFNPLFKPLIVQNNSAIIDLFTDLPNDVYYLDFDSAKRDPTLDELIRSTPVKMLFLGTEATSFTEKSISNALKDTLLDQEFDALIHFREVSLYTPLVNEKGEWLNEKRN